MRNWVRYTAIAALLALVGCASPKPRTYNYSNHPLIEPLPKDTPSMQISRSDLEDKILMTRRPANPTIFPTGSQFPAFYLDRTGKVIQITSLAPGDTNYAEILAAHLSLPRKSKDIKEAELRNNGNKVINFDVLKKMYPSQDGIYKATAPSGMQIEIRDR